MGFNLKEKVLYILKDNYDKKFTAGELAKEIVLKYPNDCEQKKNNSSQKDINIETQIAAEIATRISKLVKDDTIKIIDERPKKYYYSKKTDAVEIKESMEKNITNKKENFYNNEQDLYPILIEYLKTTELIAKRIDERKSSNKNESGTNKWLYPDMVAVENLTKDWDKTTKECAKDYYIKKTKIYSYEVKKVINRSNVREVYFQAVSNSTWANFGY